MKPNFQLRAAVTVVALWLGGCGIPAGAPPTPGAPAAGSGEALALELVAARVVRAMVVLPEIAQARQTPRVLLEAADNAAGTSLGSGDLLDRLRPLLNTAAAGRARFLDRSMLRTLAIERDLKNGDEAAAPAAPVMEIRGADLVLTVGVPPGEAAASRRSGGAVSCHLRLTEARTGITIWEERFRIRQDAFDPATEGRR